MFLRHRNVPDAKKLMLDIVLYLASREEAAITAGD